MPPSTPGSDRFAKVFLLFLVVVISLLLFAMVKGFLLAIFFAAILSGLFHPPYRRLVRLFRGRRPPASAATVILALLLIIVPLSALVGVVTSEALQVSQKVRPWVEQQVNQPDQLDNFLQRLPLADRLGPYKGELVAKVGQLAGTLGSFLVNNLASATRGTALFLFQLFIMLYAMFFFLMNGKEWLEKALYYVPLSSREEDRLVARFLSVSRATLKGTLVIGIVQGTLAGAAFAVVGIEGAAFWGTVMAVLSIIPGVGTALVWVPAAVFLFAVGRTGSALGLTIWCVAVVGTVDNVLRPWLVGKDTQMSDLLILLGTLGGLTLFGAAGIVVGPIITALFVTVWEIYAETFADLLPPREQIG